MRPALFAALVAGAAACKSATGPGGPAVSIVEYQFTPDTVTVKAGSSVTWTNNGTVNHQVASDSTSAVTFGTAAISPPMGGGGYGGGTGPGSAAVTFHTAGTFHYHCAIHPTLMKGVVIVTP
jgi:plastocyanin